MERAPWTHLLQLLDDDSPAVHEAVLAKLRELGMDPIAAMESEGIELNPAQRRRILSMRMEQEEYWLSEGWSRWFAAPADLEAFHVLASALLSAYGGVSDPRRLLDDWARRYMARHQVPDLETLVGFLFSDDGMRGDDEDYFAPRNSSLAWVLENRRGLPITLCSALILVGRRVGLDVDGVAFPGHFLASGTYHGTRVWIDAFDGGRLIGRGELVDALGRVPEETRQRVLSPASTDEICARILRNVVTSLEKAEDVRRHRRATAWLEEIEARLRGDRVADPFA
jgi:hypothetical protein